MKTGFKMKQTVRIPRYLAADWQRLRDHLAAQRAARGDPQPVNDGTVLAVAVANLVRAFEAELEADARPTRFPGLSSTIKGAPE